MTFGIRSAPRKPKDEPKAGTHKARLVGILDLGMQPAFEYKGEMVDAHFQTGFTYELVKSFMKDKDGNPDTSRPHWISEDMKESDYFESRKKCSKMMKRVYALDPTGELSNKGKNLRPLLGRPCMVELDYNEKGYLTIINVIAGDDEDTPELKNDMVFSTFEEPNIDIYRKLPDFKKKKIQEAIDFPGSNLEKALLAEGLLGDEDDKELGF